MSYKKNLEKRMYDNGFTYPCKRILTVNQYCNSIELEPRYRDDYAIIIINYINKFMGPILDREFKSYSNYSTFDKTLHLNFKLYHLLTPQISFYLNKLFKGIVLIIDNEIHENKIDIDNFLVCKLYINYSKINVINTNIHSIEINNCRINSAHINSAIININNSKIYDINTYNSKYMRVLNSSINGDKYNRLLKCSFTKK